MEVNFLGKIQSDVYNILAGEGVYLEEIKIVIGFISSIELKLRDMSTHLKNQTPPELEVVLKVSFSFDEEPTTEIKNIDKASEKFRQAIFEAIPRLQEYFWTDFKYEIPDEE